jgi:EamA-like transporter family
MVFLGLIIRFLCWSNRTAGQDRSLWSQLQPRDSHQNLGHSDLHLGDRLYDLRQHRRAIDQQKNMVFLVLSGVATGLSWLCYFRALQIGELSKVAPVDKLSVVMAMAFGALFLHERLTAREGIGGFFIAAGALILAWR